MSHAKKGNRNMLVLGATALLVLGGIGLFLASQKTGDTNTTNQDIRNEILNNVYFQNLIASGATTRPDLESLELIRPYENGFIGVSRESLVWDAATVLARKAGGEVLEPNRLSASEPGNLISWLAGNFADQLVAPAWVGEDGQARILDGQEMLAVTGTERNRRVLISWGLDTVKNGGKGEGSATKIGDPWSGFDPGPLVFEESFAKPDALGKTHFVEGSYSWHMEITEGVGLPMPIGHTFSMVWPKAVLGDSCRVEFEVEPGDDSYVAWVMKGSGTGNSSSSGLGFQIHQKELTVRRKGGDWISKSLPEPLVSGKPVTVRTDIRDAHVAVWIDGMLVASASAIEGLEGPSHGWFGMSGIRATYRNVRIWSTEREQAREAVLSPPASVRPRPNGEEIFKFSESDGPLEEGWDAFQTDQISVENGSLLLAAYHKNGWPRVIPKVEFPDNFAVEFVHRYMSPQTVNLGFFIAKAPVLPKSLKEVDEIFQVSLPAGYGTHEIRRGTRQSFASEGPEIMKWFCWGGTPLLASNAFYAPVQNREYSYRVEWLDGAIRVFQDGGLLMEAKRPPEAAVPDSPTYLGLSQFYSSSEIKSLRVYRLAGEE